MVIALKELQFLGTLVQGVIALCDSSNVVQSREVKVGLCGNGISTETGGRGGKGAVHGLATRKTFHTEETIYRVEWAWARKQFDALGTGRENSEHELRLIFQAEVRSSGAQGSWEAALGRKELMRDNRHLLLSQCWPVTRPHYFLQSFFQFEFETVNSMFFFTPCLKIRLPPCCVSDEDETPSSYMWAGASQLSGFSPSS